MTDISQNGVQIEERDLSRVTTGIEDHNRLFHHDGSAAITTPSGDTSARGYYLWDNNNGVWVPASDRTPHDHSGEDIDPNAVTANSVSATNGDIDSVSATDATVSSVDDTSDNAVPNVGWVNNNTGDGGGGGLSYAGDIAGDSTISEANAIYTISGQGGTFTIDTSLNSPGNKIFLMGGYSSGFNTAEEYSIAVSGTYDGSDVNIYPASDDWSSSTSETFYPTSENLWLLFDPDGPGWIYAPATRQGTA